MRKKVEHRSDGQGFDLVFDDSLTEIYADGVAQIIPGVPVTKISFFSSAGIDPDTMVEIRPVKFQVAMTNLAWLELVNMIVTTIKSNEAHMKSNSAILDARQDDLLANINSGPKTSDQKINLL